MFRASRLLGTAWLAIACATPLDTSVALRPANARSADLTASERLAACARDPRVLAGLLSPPACAARELFLEQPSAFALFEPEGEGRWRRSVRGAAGTPTARIERVTECRGR